jgi:hypothetical protein
VTGETRAQTLDFKMLSNSDTATLIAMRAIKAMSYPLGKITLTTNRVAWGWRQNGVFKFTWTPLGINALVFRISKIGYGQLTDGKITIEAVEDVFGIAVKAFQAPPASGWVNPVGAPLAPIFQRLCEAPYARVSTISGLTLGIWVYALCSRQDATPTDFQVWQDFGAGDVLTNDLFNFCPAGILTAIYPAATLARDATGFTIDPSGADLSSLTSTDVTGLFAGANLALIDDEIISWHTATVNSDNSVTISDILRGVLDTVPADHAQGSVVFFFTLAEQFTQPQAYGGDTTVKAKFLPSNNLGTFALSDAVENDLTTRSRYLRPYPPGNVRINGNAYGTRPATIIGDLTVTFSSRNRLTQTAGVVMIPQDQTDIAGESGQTFKVIVSIPALSFSRTYAPTSSPFVYTANQHSLDDPALSNPVVVQIFSNTAAGDSYEAQSFQIQMEAAGTLAPGRYEFLTTEVGDLTL